MDEVQMRESKTGHAIASPSQLYRILACPGSLFEVVKAPISPPSSYAQHGTHLHNITSGILFKKPEAHSLFNKSEIEDKNAIEDCLDFAKDLFQKYDDPKILVESKISLGSWGLDEIWGMLDLSVYDSHSQTMHIIDWKFGSGVRVYVMDNEQLLAYAAGSIGYPNPGVKKVCLHIVQPFINNFDSWTIHYDDLKNWVFQELEPGLVKARQSDAPYHPGEKQCKFCPAAMTCKARLEDARQVAATVFRVHSNLAIATKPELADVLNKIRSVQKYANQIEAYAAAELAHGRSFPGFKLVAGRSQRKWTNADKAEAWLLGNSSISEDKMFTKKFLSPAQAEKLDRHLKKSDDFRDMVSKPPGKPKMVDEQDPRPAVVPDAEAAKVFGEWQEEEEVRNVSQ